MSLLPSGRIPMVAFTWRGPAAAPQVVNAGPLALIEPLLDRLDPEPVIDRHLPPDPQQKFRPGQPLPLPLAAPPPPPTPLAPPPPLRHLLLGRRQPAPVGPARGGRRPRARARRGPLPRRQSHRPPRHPRDLSAPPPPPRPAQPPAAVSRPRPLLRGTPPPLAPP